MKRLTFNGIWGTGRLGLFLLIFSLGTVIFSNALFSLPEKKDSNETARGKKLFLTTGLAIRKAVVVPASVDEVWAAWTTEKGVKTFFAPEASVELAIGGNYEMYFAPKQPKGLRGGEGCRILSFVPGEMLSFTWNAPPSLPEVRKEFTWVVLYFKALEGNKTRVSLVHVGWQAGEEWQKALQYFDKAWEVVLGRLQYRFQKGPIDWKKPFTPGKNS